MKEQLQSYSNRLDMSDDDLGSYNDIDVNDLSSEEEKEVYNGDISDISAVEETEVTQKDPSSSDGSSSENDLLDRVEDVIFGTSSDEEEDRQHEQMDEEDAVGIELSSEALAELDADRGVNSDDDQSAVGSTTATVGSHFEEDRPAMMDPLNEEDAIEGAELEKLSSEPVYSDYPSPPVMPELSFDGDGYPEGSKNTESYDSNEVGGRWEAI